MRFGSKEIPGSIFKLARDRMLRDVTFTPEDIRGHLMEQAPVVLNEISSIGVNHRIIANRVMRDCVKQLVASGEIAQLKRGVWAKTTFLKAAAQLKVNHMSPIQQAVNSAPNLHTLCDLLNGYEPLDGESLDVVVDLPGLPTYGGSPVSDTRDVWSWDAHSVLRFNSRYYIERRDPCAPVADPRNSG